jgi:hypothetical protein
VRITFALIAVALVAGCGSGASNDQAATGSKSSEPAPLDRVSNQGTPFSSLLPRDEQALSRMRGGVGVPESISVEDVSILGTRGDQSLYRLSDHCYAVGPASPTTDHTFGSVACQRDFPSPQVPILDFTVFTGNPGSDKRPQRHELTVHASHGVAADGVAKVAFVVAGGEVVAEAAVIDNTFGFDPPPAGTGLSLVAYDATGEAVYRMPY